MNHYFLPTERLSEHILLVPVPVAAGSKLVLHAGETMEEIIMAIRSVITSGVSEISVVFAIE